MPVNLRALLEEMIEKDASDLHIVAGASFVCSVESTRWPVSAALIAIDPVSRSRISPTMMMFGSCRRNAFSAAANVIPTSLRTST